MPTFEEKVARAEALLLGADAWKRTRAEPTTTEYNPRKPGNACLRVTVGSGGRRNEFRSNSQKAKLPNGATLYDGGADGVFDNEVTAASHTLRFRLWVELGFPDMKELISAMREAARRRLDLERQAAGNDARKRKAEEQAGVKLDVRTKRRSLEGSDKWLEKAKVYDAHVAQLDVAIKEIEKHQLLDELKRTKGNGSKSASTVRQQLRVEKQCMTVKTYFKRMTRRSASWSRRTNTSASSVYVVGKLAKGELLKNMRSVFHFANSSPYGGFSGLK